MRNFKLYKFNYYRLMNYLGQYKLLNKSFYRAISLNIFGFLLVIQCTKYKVHFLIAKNVDLFLTDTHVLWPQGTICSMASIRRHCHLHVNTLVATKIGMGTRNSVHGTIICLYRTISNFRKVKL